MIKKIIKLTKKPESNNLVAVPPVESKEVKQKTQNVQEQQSFTKISSDSKSKYNHSEQQFSSKLVSDQKQKYKDTAEKLVITKINTEQQKKKTFHVIDDDDDDSVNESDKHAFELDKFGRNKQNRSELSHREQQPFKKVNISSQQDNQSPVRLKDNLYQKNKDFNLINRQNVTHTTQKQQSTNQQHMSKSNEIEPKQLKQIEASHNKEIEKSPYSRQKTSLVDRDFENLTKLNEKRLQSQLQASAKTQNQQQLSQQAKKTQNDIEKNKVQQTQQTSIELEKKQNDNQSEKTSTLIQKQPKKLILRKPEPSQQKQNVNDAPKIQEVKPIEEIRMQEEKPKIQEEQFQIQVEQPPIQKELPPILQESTPILEEQPPIQEEQPPIQEEQLPIQEEQLPIQEEQPPLLEEQPPIQQKSHPILQESHPILQESPLIIQESPLILEESPPIQEEQPPQQEEQAQVSEKQSQIYQEKSQVQEEKPLEVLEIQGTPKKQNYNNVEQQLPSKEEKSTQFTPKIPKDVQNVAISPIIAETMEQLFEENSNEEIKGSFAQGHQALSVSLVDYEKDQYLIEWKNVQSKQLESLRITPKSTIYSLSDVKQYAPDLYISFLEKQFTSFQQLLWEQQNEGTEQIHKKRFSEQQNYVSSIKEIKEVPEVVQFEKDQPIASENIQEQNESLKSIQYFENDEKEKNFEEINPSCFSCDKQLTDLQNKEQEDIIFHGQEFEINNQKQIDVNLPENQIDKELRMSKQSFSVEYSSQNDKPCNEDQLKERKTKSVEVHSPESTKYKQKKDDTKVIEINCEKEGEKADGEQVTLQEKANLTENNCEKFSDNSQCQLITEQEYLTPLQNDKQINNNQEEIIVEEEQKESKLQDHKPQQIIEVMQIEDNNEDILCENLNQKGNNNLEVIDEKTKSVDKNIKDLQANTSNADHEKKQLLSNQKNDDKYKEIQTININLDCSKDDSTQEQLTPQVIENVSGDNNCKDIQKKNVSSEVLIQEEEYKCREGDYLCHKIIIESSSQIKEKQPEETKKTILEAIPEVTNQLESDQSVENIVKDTAMEAEETNRNSDIDIFFTDQREDNKLHTEEQSNTTQNEHPLSSLAKINIAKQFYRKDTPFQGARKTAPCYQEKHTSSRRESLNDEYDREYISSLSEEEDQLDYFQGSSDDSQTKSSHQTQKNYSQLLNNNSIEQRKQLNTKPELLIGSLNRFKNKVEKSLS